MKLNVPVRVEAGRNNYVYTILWEEKAQILRLSIHLVFILLELNQVGGVRLGSL